MPPNLPAGPPPLPAGGPTVPVENEFDLAALKGRYVAAVRGELESDPVGTLANVALITAVLSAVTVVLLPLAVYAYRRWRRLSTAARYARAAITFAERAEPVMAFPLMVNRVLRRPGSEPSAGLVLVCFDSNKGAAVDYMGELAVTVGEGTSEALSDADRRFCQRLMDDEQYVPFRRRKLPASITGGVDVYACDLVIDPHLLPGRHISDDLPLLPCMAERGDAGWISQIPFWVFAGGPPPDAESKEAFVLTLVALEGLAEHAAGAGS